MGVAGAVGIGAYAYMQFGGAGVQTQTTKEKPEASQQKSPFDIKEYRDFTLKRIEPYNHNTAKYICLLSVFSTLLIRF